MKGFLVGMLTLIALQALGSDRRSRNAGKGLDALSGLLQHTLSPKVAGLHNFAGAAGTGSGPGRVTAGGASVSKLPTQRTRQQAVRAG